jgi:acetyl-CoA C-acetyltransferase
VTVAGKKGDVVVAADEHPRPETTLASIAKLPPVFEENGTVHAGNSSGITDGGAAVVLASETAAGKSGVEPLARIAAWTSSGVEPSRRWDARGRSRRRSR